LQRPCGEFDSRPFHRLKMIKLKIELIDGAGIPFVSPDNMISYSGNDRDVKKDSALVLKDGEEVFVEGREMFVLLEKDK